MLSLYLFPIFLNSFSSLQIPTGPDGYSANFFKKNWDLVGQDFIDAIMEFFTNGKLLKAWNGTALTLIPKVAVPNTMRDFRPIACCNVIYKCISEVLVHRWFGLPEPICLHCWQGYSGQCSVHARDTEELSEGRGES